GADLCVASSGAARAPHRRDARKHATVRGPAQCRRGDARGLEVSPGSLLKDELVQRQTRDAFAPPRILELKLLQPLYLFDLQPTKFLAPAIIGNIAYADLADRIRHALSLRRQNINLPKLGDNLFSLVTLPCHRGPPGCQRHTSSRTTSVGGDQWRGLVTSGIFRTFRIDGFFIH